MFRRALVLGACLLVGAATTGCMNFKSVQGDRPISTHVTDWRDQVIYQVMVDRFADGDRGNDYRVDRTSLARYQGGDWLGVEDHLDYLQKLGVTALWISPIVKNVETDSGVDGYHGYWTQDFTKLNPHFGNLAALRSLVDAAHSRGMLVILDIVVNHVGQLFYYDINLNGQPDENVMGEGPVVAPQSTKSLPDGTPIGTSIVSHVNEYDPDYDPRGVQAWTSLGLAGPAPIIFRYDPATNHMPPEPAIFQEPRAYHRRGRVYNWNDPQQVEKGDFPGGLKDINTEDPQVRQTLIDLFVHWVELTDVDGFRIDTIKHVDYKFWETFCPQVRKRLAAEGKHNFFMFGESFDGSDQLDGSYTYKNQLDSVFYFPQYYQVFRDVFQQHKATKEIEDLFNNRLGQNPLYNTVAPPGGIGVPPNKALVNFIDNHDVARFLFGNPDKKALENALLFLFTEDGIPCVYYGTEQGFNGGNDPANRADLWKSHFDETNPLYKWISRLARIRKKYRVLTHGNLKIVWSSPRTHAESDAGIIAFERSGGDAPKNAYALVVINTNQDHSSSPEYQGNAMTTSLPAGTKLVNVLDPKAAPLTVESGGALHVTVPADSGVLLVRQQDLVPGL